MRVGYFLSSEEFTPRQLLEQAAMAEEAGFASLWISDHYHPWLDAQGQSPFVWSMIGAVSRVCGLPVTTAVTCPTVRIHPAVIAQAAATSAVLLGDRFALGVGTGEALNEHILGDPWPPAEVRLEMLEEAVEIIRELWTGKPVNHHGRHYTVENARLYTLPDLPPPVYVSGFGQKSIALAGRVGDGFMTTRPDAEAVRLFREQGGQDKLTQAGYKVCWAPTAAEAISLAHTRWPTMGVPGEAGQVLPQPAHFEQLAAMVTPEDIASTIACGPDPAEHLRAYREYAGAGFDEVFVSNIGPYQREFFEMYRKEIIPATLE